MLFFRHASSIHNCQLGYNSLFGMWISLMQYSDAQMILLKIYAHAHEYVYVYVCGHM